MSFRPLIAVDIGNSRIKAGIFPSGCHEAPRELPSPTATLPLETAVESPLEDSLNELARWLSDSHSPRELVACSVNRKHAAQFGAWAQSNGYTWRQVDFSDFPFEIRTDEPARVGVDRLVAAYAAGRLCRSRESAIVVDLGTAITVDVVDRDGGFAGGAILPGVALSAAALASRTDALPCSPLVELREAPPAIGKSTLAALESGIYWGSVGAIRELIARQLTSVGGSAAVFLTGGAAPIVAAMLSTDDVNVRHEPHLVLSGLALLSQDGPSR